MSSQCDGILSWIPPAWRRSLFLAGSTCGAMAEQGAHRPGLCICSSQRRKLCLYQYSWKNFLSIVHSCRVNSSKELDLEKGTCSKLQVLFYQFALSDAIIARGGKLIPVCSLKAVLHAWKVNPNWPPSQKQELTWLAQSLSSSSWLSNVTVIPWF